MRRRRSTLRLRDYFKRRRASNKYIVSAIVNNPDDRRYYAEVRFLEFREFGLLDTGANVTCIGSSLADYDFSKFDQYVPGKSFVRTADGKFQRTYGYLMVDVVFRNQTRSLKVLIVPSITQRLILGVDFWKAFGLASDVFDSALIVAPSDFPHTNRFLRVSGVEKISPVQGSESVGTLENRYPLTPEQSQQLRTIIALFPDFHKQGLGRTTLLTHDIDVGSSRPIKQRYYPVSPAVEKLMYQEIDRMLALGVIEPSSSPWSSPMRLVVKPNKVRLCLDARKVNQVTKKDAYPLPSMEGIFSRLPRANIISKLDLKDAYWQIALSDEAKPLTAFNVPGRPLYQFVVMPFGLCTAPQTMCRLMDQLIPPELRHCVFGYLDDLIIVSKDFPSHISALVRIAEEFRRANLTLNVDKSHFCVTEVKYLGYMIGNGGIRTDPEKIDAITRWPAPRSIRQVRGFLGLAGWYRRFIKNFSSLTFPITETLSSKRKFHWTPEADEAFELVKKRLTTAPVLINPDFSKKFFVHCDASDYGIGAVLVQLDENGSERPVAYMSKKLNTAQRNYSVTEKECLAAVEAVKRFRCYLEMQEFEIVTDHSSLVWLMGQPDLSGRLARWVFKLQAFKFSVSHRKGRDHVVPDSLSRRDFDEISGLDLSDPEIDLNSRCFDDEDYRELRDRIGNDQSAYPDLRVLDRYVYIRTEFYSGNEDQEANSWKLWVPRNLRDSLISRFHDSAITAHGGMSKTLDLIRRNFYWPGMVSDTRDFVRKCEICKGTKHPNFVLRPEMGKQVITTRPFQRFYIDILGPYPRSKGGHIGLLIVLDHLTKFHWLCPMKKFTAQVIGKFLLSDIFHVYGVPEVIVSDNGSQFRSNDFNAFLTKLGIQHTYTALYSPQANASERVNRSMIAGIRAFLKKDHKMWDEHLSSISCALRNSVHHTIKCSPYFATFGFDMVTHGDSYRLLRNVHMLDESHSTLKREDQLALLRKDLRENISKAHATNRDRYNLRTRPVSYSVGQTVFRRNFSQSSAEKQYSAKFAPVFVKAVVKSKLGTNYYVLQDVDGNSSGTYHAKDMRP